jgi:DNA-binding transcriptional ArsR family regulator
MATATIFAALSDATRCEIVAMLADGERDVASIANAFPISGPAISQHLKSLREAGLVKVRAQAQRRLYSLDRETMVEAADWLARVAGFWEGRLDALAEAIVKENNRQNPEENPKEGGR